MADLDFSDRASTPSQPLDLPLNLFRRRGCQERLCTGIRRRQGTSVHTPLGWRSFWDETQTPDPPLYKSDNDLHADIPAYFHELKIGITQKYLNPTQIFISEWLIELKKYKADLDEIWIGGFTEEKLNTMITPEHVNLNDGRNLINELP